MTHLAFITLFLGLVLGPHDVEMKVTGPAARIELQLDGRIVSTLSAAPWKAAINLGSRLVPHNLVARALDADGRELARAEQSINLPHALSELQLVLERDSGAKPVAVHVLWESLEGDRPRHLELSLDGKALRVDEHLRAPIGEVDLDRPHVLRGRAISPSGKPVSTEIAFGGGLEDQTGARLTAIAIRVVRAGASLTVADLQRSLRIGATPVKVAAVEELPPQILVVRHPVRTEAAMRLEPVSLRLPPSLRRVGTVGGGMTATFAWPVVSASPSRVAALFEWSTPIDFVSASDFKSLLARVPGPAADSLLFAEAVAVAGLRALSTRQPRAVILVVGEANRDASWLTPEQARDYLRSIGVPLYVWSLGVDASSWGDASDITSPGGYRKAFEQLEADLRSQRIVWVEGDHLPGDVQSVSGDIETLAKR